MRTLHLFAGAGGGLLADLILGHEPICAVEWDAYCCAVLRERADEGWFPGLHVFEGDTGWWETEPGVGRVVDGMADRVDQLKALGNGQVPLQAAFAFRCIFFVLLPGIKKALPQL